MVALKRADCLSHENQLSKNLLGARVLGHRFGALADGMLGEFTRKEKPDSRLDLPGRNCRSFVVMSKTRGFCGDALKDVIDKAVHYTHRLAGDAGVRVDLLQHLVNVDSVGLLPLLLAVFLIALGDVLGCFAGFLHSFTAGFWRYLQEVVERFVHKLLARLSETE